MLARIIASFMYIAWSILLYEPERVRAGEVTFTNKILVCFYIDFSIRIWSLVP